MSAMEAEVPMVETPETEPSATEPAVIEPAVIEPAVIEPAVIEPAVIEMVHPLPGFPGQREFTLEALDEDGVLAALRAVADPSLRLLVAPPALFFPDYAPVLDDATVADLSITSADEVVLLVVLNAGSSLAETTANLRAPVVINTATHQACQVILDDARLSLQTPLVP